MKKLIKTATVGLSIIVVTTLFTGCEAVKRLNTLTGVPNTPQEFVKRSSDTYLATVFSKYFNNEKYPRTSGTSADLISLTTRVIDFNESIRQEKEFDTVEQRFEKDILVKEYKDAILKRGNSYKVYNNHLNKVLLRASLSVKGEFKTRDRVGKYAYDWTPTVVEYNMENKIVSAMVRYHKISVAFNQFDDPMAPVQVHSSVMILTDYKARSLQNRVSNRMFNENFLYGSK